MSFIDKALERAKTLRQKKKTPIILLEKESVFQGPSPTPPWPEPEATTAGSISYGITRTVSVNLEILQRNRMILGEEDDPIAEEYKLLRTHILQRTKSEQLNVLMITGPLPGEGKTLTSINLAISISQEVERAALLVDADLRYPSMHRYFGIRGEPGLVDHLENGVPLSEVLVHPEGLGNLVLLPAGRRISQGLELISSTRMADLVQELKHFYPDRYVLFDFPPLLSYADALAFAPMVDGIIIVVEAGKTAREDIDRCLHMLKDFPVLGFVLNKVDTSQQSHYHYRNGRDDAKWKFPWFNWVK
ncbi:MAG: AAA family ATPase [Candidatus Schekmanbacteria bacterium]|nr:AAA family ATPase [Candidatus Schekmanbacteria bacterium]